MLHVADLIDFQPGISFPDPEKADQTAIRESLVLTGEAAEICNRVFRRLATSPSPQRGAFLLAGIPGVGKTYLSRLMEILLVSPEEPLWSRLQHFLPPPVLSPRALRAQRIVVPTDPTHDLAHFLIETMGGFPEDAGIGEWQETPAAYLRTKETTPPLAEGAPGLVALDNISRRIDNCSDPGQFDGELAFLRNLSDVLSRNGVLVVLVVDEKHIRPERGRTAPLERLAHSCDFLWLSRNNIAEIISLRIAPRNAQQRGEIENITGRFRRSISYADSKGTNLAQIYPLHPQTFNAMFALRKILPGFSPLNFVRDAIASALSRPADQLVTPEELRAYALSNCGPDPAGENAGKGGDLSKIEALLRSFPPESHPSPSSRGDSLEQEKLGGIGRDEGQILEWAALLSGIGEIRTLGLADAEVRMKEWAVAAFEDQVRSLSTGLHPLPEAFLTTGFQKEVLQFEHYLELVNPVIRQLSSGSLGIRQAIGLVRRHFNDDQDRLMAWKALMENLCAVVHWLPTFRNCREYVCGAFPISREELDSSRNRLLQVINQPHLLLNPAERISFERSFLEYKAGYVRHYCSLHREALQIVGVAEEQNSKVDATALRNLELLSSLRHTNQIYLHRVRIIGKWLQHNQCDLPVTEILDNYPRCYCNFNPEGDRHLTLAAEQINSVVQEGIEYFRAILRQCKRIIIEELKLLRVGEAHSKPIAAILSGGPLIPLNSRTMAILNQITEKHPTELLAAIRSIKS